MPLEVNGSLSVNFHLINLIKFTDDAKLGGAVSTLKNIFRIQNDLNRVENGLK